MRHVRCRLGSAATLLPGPLADRNPRLNALRDVTLRQPGRATNRRLNESHPQDAGNARARVRWISAMVSAVRGPSAWSLG